MIKHRFTQTNTQIHTDGKILSIVRRALEEDIGRGDITTNSLISPDLRVKGVILAKEKGILAGLDIAKLCFKFVDKDIKFIPEIKDGYKFKKSQVIARIEGRACKILNAERTSLNFLMHLSGVATLTHRFVQKIKSYKVKITDTRKTLAGLRILEKYAVRVGGGTNHRMGLYDQVLIKENHIKVIGDRFWVMGFKEIKRAAPQFKIEVEVKTLKEFNRVLKLKLDIIMLDNMSIKDIKKAVRIRNNLLPNTYDLKPKLEVSGNVNLNNVRKLAQTGIDMISIGALTHSAKAIDMSLEILNVKPKS